MRRGQYTLITFIVAAFILLSLVGIVSNLVTDKQEQIEKAQVLTALGDRVTMMRSIMTQERQVGIDFTGIHLGLLGGRPKGTGNCGSLVTDDPSWIMKSTPYWFSSSETMKYYQYPGKLVATDDTGDYDAPNGDGNYYMYRFDDLRRGLYSMPQRPFILNGELIMDGVTSDYVVTLKGVDYLFLDSGSHYIVIVKDGGSLCDYSTCDYLSTSANHLNPEKTITLQRYIPDAVSGDCNTMSCGGTYDFSDATLGFTVYNIGDCVDGDCGKGISYYEDCDDAYARVINDDYGNAFKLYIPDNVCKASFETESYSSEGVTKGLVEWRMKHVSGAGKLKIQLIDDREGSLAEFSLTNNQFSYTNINKLVSVDASSDWHHVKCFFDFNSHTYDLYFDDELIATDVGFHEVVGSQFSHFKAEIDGSTESEAYVDEVMFDWLEPDEKCVGACTQDGSACSKDSDCLAYSDYELCVPDNEFTRSIFELFLNTHFSTMTKVAFDQIKSLMADETFDLSGFAITKYKAEVNKLGKGSVFVTFYPLDIQLFKIIHKVFFPSTEGTAYAKYQGSYLLYDAFESDLASFQSIGRELINDKVINGLINEVISRHSVFPVFTSITKKGSYHKGYENFFNGLRSGYSGGAYDSDWAVSDFNENDLNIDEAFKTVKTKPYCLYYLREACQFLSDEVPDGMRGDYVKLVSNTPVYADNKPANTDEDPLYSVYNEFTKGVLDDYSFGSKWVSASNACQQCHDVGLYNNPCLNLQNGSPCFDCFNKLMGGSNYDSLNNYYDANSDGKFDPLNGDYIVDCYDAVNEEILPLLNKYIVYRFDDLEDELRSRYGYGWVLDAQELNVTSISFKGITSSNQYFNSSCFDCREVSGLNDCEFLTSDLAITGKWIRKGLDDWKSHYVDISGDDNVTIGLNIENLGNTNELVGIRLFVDAYNNLVVAGLGSDYLMPLKSDFEGFTKLGLTGSFDNTEAFIADTDKKWDEDIYDYVAIKSDFKKDGEMPEGFPSKTFNFSFNPSELGLGFGDHVLKACVYAIDENGVEFNDDFDLTNNCVNLGFGICADGDVSQECCENSPTWKGEWFDLTSYPSLGDDAGQCCGDDKIPSMIIGGPVSYLDYSLVGASIKPVSEKVPEEDLSLNNSLLRLEVDLNNDGLVDELIADSNGFVVKITGGSLSNIYSVPLGVVDMTAVDLDSDSYPDVIIDDGTSLLVYLNNYDIGGELLFYDSFEK